MWALKYRDWVASVVVWAIVSHMSCNKASAEPVDVKQTMGTTPATLHIAALRDISDSMKVSGRHEVAGEALALMASILSGRLTIVDFSSNARSSSYLMPNDLTQATRAIRSTPVGRGTSYIPALETIPATTTAVVLLSDGVPSEESEKILGFLKSRIRCPVHTVGVGSSAEGLLRDMAAETGGGFYRARDARTLLDAFLRIVWQVASVRTVESTGAPVNLGEVVGPVLCIGLNAEPSIRLGGLTKGGRQEDQMRSVFRLADIDVHVAREMLDTPSPVCVGLEDVGIRSDVHLIAATFCGSDVRVHLERTEEGKVVASARVVAGETNAAATEIDTKFVVVAPDGRVHQVIEGRTVGQDQVAEFTSPEGPYDVRVETTDATGGRRVQTRAIRTTDALPLADPHVDLAADVRAIATTAGAPIQVEVVLQFGAQDEDLVEAALRDYVPTVAVQHPDGTIFDTIHHSTRFGVSPPAFDSGRTVCRVDYHGANAPGNYKILLQQPLTAMQFRHPEASTDVTVAAIEKGSVDLLLVAHRKTGRVVLAQSGQRLVRSGLAGVDRISIEVLCGSMDRRLFSALGNMLHVKWLCEDGSVQSTELQLEGDRYTTEPVLANWEGQLTCHLEIGDSRSSQRLEVQAAFVPVAFEMRQSERNSVPPWTPVDTVVPLRFTVQLRVGGRSATSEEAAELLALEERVVSLTVEDNTGKVVRTTEYDPGDSGSADCELVLAQPGTFDVTVTLIGRTSRKVWDQIQWTGIRVAPSPLDVQLCRHLEDGSFATTASPELPGWIPAFFLAPDEDLFYSIRLAEGQPTSFFIESVALADEPGTFDADRNAHFVPAVESADVECMITLRRLGAAGFTSQGPPIHVRRRLSSTTPSVVRWWRLLFVAFLVFFLPAIGVLWKSFRHAKRVQSLGSEVTLSGETAFDTKPLVPQDSIWPSTRMILCEEDGTYQLLYPGQYRSGAVVVARFEQLPDGRVRVRAASDLLDLSAGQSLMLEPGASDLQVDKATTVSINLGEEEFR